MAAKKDTSGKTYPSSYGSNNLFSDEETLTHDHMNFIAKNLDAIIKCLSWNEEVAEAKAAKAASAVQMGDAT